jgi:PhnB protein
MQFIPYLDFDGNCQEAFAFYAQAFRGRIVTCMTYGQSPMAAQVPAEARDRVMHVSLESGGGLLMGADAPPGTAPSRGCVNAQVDSPEEAERLFAALADGGTVQMALQETFWAHRFGMAIDRYGKAWMVNAPKPMP